MLRSTLLKRPRPVFGLLSFHRSASDFVRSPSSQSLLDEKAQALRDHLSTQPLPVLRAELRDMIAEGQYPHPKRFTFLMRRATNSWPDRDLQEAHQTFELGVSLYEGNNYLWAEMIASCTRCKDSVLAERVFNDWKAMRERRDLSGGLIVLEAMIAHYTAVKDPEKVARIYEQIRNEGLVPSGYAASSLATSFAKFGEFDKAVAIFRQNDSWIAANAIINHMCRAGRMDEALVVMNDAARLGHAPNLETFNNLLRAAARSGEKNAIRVVLERMQITNVPPNEQTFRMILIGLAYCSGKIEVSAQEIRSFFLEAKSLSEGAFLDPRTSGAAILAFLRIGDVNNAMSVLQREILAEPSLCVPFGVWERLIECYVRQFDSGAWRKKPTRHEAREGALLKLWRIMRQALEREVDHSSYAHFRWSRAFLCLAKFREEQNMREFYEYAAALPCFQAAQAELKEAHAGCLVGIDLLEEALELNVGQKALFPAIFAFAQRRRKAGDDAVWQQVKHFCQEHDMDIKRRTMKKQQKKKVHQRD